MKSSLRIRNGLSDRKQRVIIKSFLLEQKEVNGRVPLSSVLGPILLIMHVND